MLSSNCCVSGPVRTTRQPPTPIVPHAHEPAFGINQNRQPFRLGADREPRAQELFQSGAEAERETREAIVRSGKVGGADAAGQKRSKTFDFGDDELTREVRVKQT
jgi:hypothetical protein